MKRIGSRSGSFMFILFILSILFAASGFYSLAAEPASPPADELMAGRTIFQGRYLHRSRGHDYGEPASVWVKQLGHGGIAALCVFANQTTLAVGAPDHRPLRYSTAQGPALEGRWHLVANRDKVLKLRNWSDTQREKEYAAEDGAIFDPNTRPDPYAMAHILVRRFNLKPGESREFAMFDWSAAGEKQTAFPTYRVRVEHKGKESVTVPAGTFEANHLVQTQLTSADTWFKKRVGHVTEFWYLDDWTIVRILRQREPYEILLQERGAAAPASEEVFNKSVELMRSTQPAPAASPGQSSAPPATPPAAPSAAAQPAAAPAERPTAGDNRVALHLADGSVIKGVPEAQSIRVKTSFAPIDIPMGTIRKIEMPGEGGDAKILLKNGDQLTGALELDGFNLKTVFGPVRVDRQTRVN